MKKKHAQARKSNSMKVLAIVSLLAILLSMTLSVNLSKAQETPTLITDKADYSPEETVTVFGSGFLANAMVTVSVTRPDATVSSWDVASGEDGCFTTTYLLDGIMGIYTVTATDGTNTETTVFTDATPTSTTLYDISNSLVTGQTNVPFSGTVSASPAIPIGSDVQLQISDQSSFPTAHTTIITVTTSSGGSFSGTFTAPSTSGTYYFRAEFQAITGQDGWQKSDSSPKQEQYHKDTTLRWTRIQPASTPHRDPVGMRPALPQPSPFHRTST